MNKTSNNAFTLIELLAVIVILAVILVIAVPQINKTITDSKKKSFESDAKIALSQLDIKNIGNNIDVMSINTTNIEELLGIKADNYDSVIMTKVSGSPYVLIKGKNKWNGLMAYGTYNNIIIESDANYNSILNNMGYNEEKGVNEPKLALGMKPIKWDGTKWVSTIEDDTSWYSYGTTIDTRNWANAKTADGSMWVWIPRYIYKITSKWHESGLSSTDAGTIEVQFSKGINDNWNNAVIGDIDTGTTSNASNNKWTNHPGFTFGSTELTGIWVAKFEATAIEGIENPYTSDYVCLTEGDNVTTKTLKVIPNATSWRCITVSNIFTVTRNLETNNLYGWGTSGNNIDTHLPKNVEWGVVAYLSKSKYGKETEEIWTNNAGTFTTGCAGNSVTAGKATSCLNTYETTNGVKASTTGTIYGIYDITGGAWEYTSAYVDNGNPDSVTYGSLIMNANSKYKDVYEAAEVDTEENNFALAVNKKGDAVYETSGQVLGKYSWYIDYSHIPTGVESWFVRSGGYFSGTNAGPFNYIYGIGKTYTTAGFRPVIAVASGL